MPGEIRLTGGAARSQALRGILAAALDSTVRTSSREEAGAAGAARIAAVNAGHCKTMSECVSNCILPMLYPIEVPDPELVDIYQKALPI